MAGVGRKPNTGQVAGQGPGDPAYMTMVARAKALIPQLRDRAAKTEELRRLPPETERDLHDAGLFRIVQPKRVGGSELDYVSLVDCADMLGRADASVAWNFANLASHHWMLGMFDQRAQDEVWGKDVDTLIASSFIFPAGRARKVEGGYRLPSELPVNLYQLTPEELLTEGIVALPGSLGEAIYEAERSELVAATLGEHVFEWFIRNKKAEWQEYIAQVTQWEVARYLPVL